MKVDIYIREKTGTREIRVPIIPEEIQFTSGDATAVAYDIIGLGPVEVPSGTELGGWKWKSEFPGELRKNDPMQRGEWIAPKTYDSILNDWKKKGTELNLLVTGYPINADVYLKGYSASAAGAFGDISYEIAFAESRKIVVTTTTEKQPESRPSSTSSTSTYTIKSGDTLWAISKKFYGNGNKWSTIYNANKDIIEKTAKKYGKKSSNNGHWIYPGVTLTIPGASSSSSSSATTQGTTTEKAKSENSASQKATAEQTKAYTSKRNSGVDAMVNKITG